MSINIVAMLGGFIAAFVVAIAYFLGRLRGYAKGRADYQVITNPWQAQGSYTGKMQGGVGGPYPKQPGDYDL